MKRFITLSSLLIFVLTLSAQHPAKYWVEFKDKKDSPYSIDRPEEFLSPRAIEKRQRFDIPVTSQDLPVNESYIKQLLAIDQTMVLLTKSKWLNGVTVYSEEEGIMDKILALPFVSGVECTIRMDSEEDLDYPHVTYAPPTKTTEVLKIKKGEDLNYGYSYSQTNINRAQWLHRMGAHGEGMFIMVLDGGFENANEIPQFEALRNEGRLIGTRNFVQPGRSVFLEGTHGTMTLSCMAGYKEEEMMGTAPKATYFLAQTEDGRSENKIEEDNWVAGLEWADSLGCDVLSSSLGYYKFDNKSQSYQYEDLNGKVSRSSIAASMAASKGIVVCVSAGNEGNGDWHYITSPADADSILTIGAVDRDYKIAEFSSFGPTADGRIKPDGLAIGSQAVIVTPESKVDASYGTSFSAPIFAGMVTCLWQLFPDKTAADVIDAIHRAGPLYDNPNYHYGLGLTNFVTAYNHLARSNDASVLAAFGTSSSNGSCEGICYASVGVSSFTIKVSLDGTPVPGEQVIRVKGKSVGDYQFCKFKVKLPKCPKGHDYAIAKVQIICPEGISYEQLIGILPK